AREEIGVRQRFRMAENSSDLAQLICTVWAACVKPDLEQRLRDRFTRPLGQQPSDGQELCQIRRRPKAWISAEEFIAAQSRECNLQTGLARAPRYKKRVHAVHARLIERADGLEQP